MRKYHILIQSVPAHDEAVTPHFDHATALSVIQTPRWTAAQLEEATKGMRFPPGTTVWDKFVAYNSFYDDLKDVLSVEDILKGAYAYFFADSDAPDGKIYHYMQGMRRL